MLTLHGNTPQVRFLVPTGYVLEPLVEVKVTEPPGTRTATTPGIATVALSFTDVPAIADVGVAVTVVTELYVGAAWLLRAGPNAAIKMPLVPTARIRASLRRGRMECFPILRTMLSPVVVA
jgi:hypothetical protein